MGARDTPEVADYAGALCLFWYVVGMTNARFPFSSKPAPADATAEALGLIVTKLDAMDRRQMEHAQEVRSEFEQIDKRFEQIDRRFEQIDKRFEQIDKRFEQIDRRFEQIDKRFEQVDQRFDGLSDQMRILMENQLEQQRMLKKLLGE